MKLTCHILGTKNILKPRLFTDNHTKSLYLGANIIQPQKKNDKKQKDSMLFFLSSVIQKGKKKHLQ